MNIKKRFGGVMCGAVAVMAIMGVGLPGAAAADTRDYVAAKVPSLAPALLPIGAPATCAFQTNNTGNYVTAVGGGGRTTDVIHTDATTVQAKERFTLVDAGDGTHYGIKTLTGNYLTAVDGGGRSSDTIHSNATLLLDWEKFALVPQGGSLYAIQTVNGHYLTAAGGGGRTTDVIHTDATVVLGWELFLVRCDLTTVPDVFGLDIGVAENAIRDAGLRVTANRDDNCRAPFGTVLGQSPNGGTSVSRGSLVTITVSSGDDRNGRPCP
jgi:hypothetical protein